MNNWMRGYWLTQEQVLSQDCLRSLIGSASSILIQPMAGVDIDSFCDQIVGQLWEQGYSDNAFYVSWDELEYTFPPNIVGQVIGLPVGNLINGPQDLDKVAYTKDKPIIMIFSGVRHDNNQSWSEFLSIWSTYLYGFKAINEQGSGLRFLLCIDTDSPGLGRHCIVPEPFTFWSWPELDEATIENFILEHLDDFCEPVSTEIKQYTLYRIMNLGGNRKLDLLELMRLAGEQPLRRNPGSVADLCWSIDNVLVKQAVSSLQAMDTEIMLPILKQLFSRGGFVSLGDERGTSGILERLWEHGLYTPPWADKTFGALTPRALAALRWLSEEDIRFAIIKGIIPLPWADRVAREIMDRCLQIERMLKRRAVQLIGNSSQLQSQLKNTMDSASRSNNQKTNREVIRESVRWQGYDEFTDDLILLEACTLGSFFYLFDSLGLQQHGSYKEHRRFLEIRNTLAHARRADWDIYKGFLDIEERLIGE